MTADDSIGDPGLDPPSKGGPDAPTRKAQAASLCKAILEAWGYLFQSREVLLIRIYTSWTGDRGDDLIAPLTLDEVRRRLEAAKGPMHPSEAGREAFESRLVLWTRLSAAWTVFWTTVGPAAVVAVFFVSLFRTAPATVSVGGRWTISLVAAALLFPFACLAGLAIQNLFVRPITYALNRLLFPPDRGSNHGPDERGL